MTIYFWLKLNKDDIDEKCDQYILSSGGQSKESRGFAFLDYHDTFMAVVSVKDKQWKMSLDKSVMKMNEWMQITFVWNAKEDSFTIFINGEKGKSVNSVTVNRPDNFTILTIGRPNNSVFWKYMMRLKMAYLALWDKPLKDDEVAKAFKNGKFNVWMKTQFS